MNILKLAFFTLCILCQNISQAQAWGSYQSEQQINDLAEIDDELLMATDAGLVVMNKSTLEKTIFNKGNSNLSHNHIQSIEIDANGIPWIGTYDAVVQRFDGSDFQDQTMLEGVSFNPNTLKLYDFEIAANGDIWLGTSAAIFHKQGQTWTSYDADDLGTGFFEAWDIEINDNGDVFVASNDIFKFSNGAWLNISADNIDLEGYLDADLYFSESGDLYFSGDLDEIGRYDGETWTSFPIDFNGSEALKFIEDAAGNIYFNSKRNGIFKLENEVFVPEMDAQTAAFNNESDYFYIDNQDNRWLNNGINLSVNQNGNIQSTTISEYTLANNGISKIRKTADGDLYFVVTYADELAILSPNGTWSSLPLPSELLPFENFNDVLFLADNDIWIATNEGYHHYDGDWTFTALTNTYSIIADATGKIYILSNGNVLVVDNDGTITDYNVDNSPIAHPIMSAHGVDADGNLWIGSYDWNAGSAIQMVATDGTWTTYLEADFPAIDQPRGDFHFDNEGNVWIPTSVFGAAKFDGTTWTNPYTGNVADITNTDVQSIESDATGKMYFAHQYGVTTLLDEEWENLIIEDVPSNLSSDSYVTFDDEGTLWWANTRDGLFAYSPLDVDTDDFETQTTPQLSIYPNPAVNFAMLDFTTQSTENIDIHVYNSIGQLQLSKKLGKFTAGTFQERIEVSDFAKGFYVVQLVVNERIFTKRLVIQ